MTKDFPALDCVARLTARGLLSLVLGTCAFPQDARPPETLNPSLFQLQHTPWTERDGAPPAINDISQAPDGSLWLGSGEGLYRFDGFTFERVRAIDGDSPAPTEVFAILATSNGDLWIGTSYNGAILLRNGVAKRFPKFEGIPPNTTVWRLAEDLDGTIWAGTASGLQRFDGSQWRSVGKAWGLPETVAFWPQVDSNGTLWAEANGHGCFKLTRGSHHFERLADTAQGAQLFAQSPSGEYWASTTSGVCPLAEVLNGTAGPHCVVHDNISQPITGSPTLVFDRRGNLWMRSARREGIGRLDAAAFRDAFRPGHPEGNVESFTKRDGLTSDDGAVHLSRPARREHLGGHRSWLGPLPRSALCSRPTQARHYATSVSRRKRTVASGLAARWRRIVDRLSGWKVPEDYGPEIHQFIASTKAPHGTLWLATYLAQKRIVISIPRWSPTMERQPAYR